METDPDWKGYNEKIGETCISKNSTIKNYVIINKSTTNIPTTISDGCYIMPFCFIGHDSVLGKNVQMTPGSKVAGFCNIGDNTVLGMNSSVHQYSNIGKYCMLGANSFFKGESPDGIIWVGTPAIPKKINKIGLDRANLGSKTRKEIEKKAQEFIDNFC